MPLRYYNVPHLQDMSHLTSIFLRVNKEKNVYTVIMKQSYVFVLDKCEITVDKKNYTLNPTLKDLHKLRKSKSVTLCPTLCYVSHSIFLFSTSYYPVIKLTIE